MLNQKLKHGSKKKNKNKIAIFIREPNNDVTISINKTNNLLYLGIVGIIKENMVDEFSNLVNIYKNTLLGVFLTSASGKLLKYNSNLTKILGYKSLEEFDSSLINIFTDIYLDPAERERIISEIGNSQEISIYEVKLKRRNGSVFDAKILVKSTSGDQNNERCFVGVVEDVTQQKIKEDQGKFSEIKYKDLFDNSNDAIFFVNDFTVIEYNNKTCELFEIPEDVKEFGFFRLFPEKQPDGSISKDRAELLIKEVIEGKTQKLDWVFVSFKKKQIFCEVSFSKLSSVEGKYFHVIVRDITERIVNEQKLAQSREWYKLLVETAPIGIVRTSIDGKILFINKILARIAGFNDQQEFIDYFPSMLDIYKNKQDRDAIIEQLSQGKTVNTRLEVFAKNKQTRTVNVIATPIISNSNQVNVITIVEDITEKVKLERQIKERDEMVLSVVNSFPFELFVTDINNKIVIQNDFSKQMIGDFLGKNYEDFPVSNEAKLRWKNEAQEVRKNKILDYEINIEHEGKLLQLRRIKTPLFGNNKVLGIINMSIDITETKQLQKEIELHRDNLEYIVKQRTKEIRRLNEMQRVTNEELSAANEYLTRQKNELEILLNELKQTQQKLIQSEKMASVGVLTAGIAHEINNPINFISSGLTGLEIIINDILFALDEYSSSHCSLNNECEWKQRLDEVDKKHRVFESKENLPKLISSMRSGVQRTTEIVKGLRTFSRLDIEKMLPSNINELIDSSLIILKNKYKDHIEIIKKYRYLKPVYCFPGKLSQVFLNLLINAIQAIDIKGKIEITTQKPDDLDVVEIVFKDNGRGIPEDVIDKIFDPFFTTKAVGDGTGLGLSIVHSIISEHKGKIEVVSEENKGTEFKITLPIGIK